MMSNITYYEPYPGNKSRHIFSLGKNRADIIVKQFVLGYEVENCPLRLWEQTILEGYKVFRQVRKNNGGIVIGDRNARTIEYRPIDGE